MIYLELTEEDAKILKEILQDNIIADDLTSSELDVIGYLYEEISKKTCDDEIVFSEDCEDLTLGVLDERDDWIHPIDLESKG